MEACHSKRKEGSALRYAAVCEISPFVRYFHTVEPSSWFYATAVIPCDHRLFFLRRGSGTLLLDTCEEPMRAGDLAYIPAGKPYRWLSYSADAELIGVNFDFFQDHRHLAYPIPPIPQERFSGEEPLEHVSFSDAPALDGYLTVRRASALLEPFRQMEEETAEQRLFYAEHNSACLKWILSYLARTAQSGEDQKIRQVTSQIIDLVRRRYAEPISNEEIAAELNYHPNYLNRLMLQATGHTLHAYLINYRFDRALNLLMMTELPIGEVAARSGFSDLSHFCRLFRRRTGYSPSQFRKTQTVNN